MLRAVCKVNARSNSRCYAVHEQIETGFAICKQGAVAEKMYLLMSGTCVVTVSSRTVGKFRAVDVFGENALFGNKGEQVCRSATVTAVSALEVFSLTRQDLTELVESKHSIWKHLD
jgi:CRP-like cAMP-binding protein